MKHEDNFSNNTTQDGDQILSSTFLSTPLVFSDGVDFFDKQFKRVGKHGKIYAYKYLLQCICEGRYFPCNGFIVTFLCFKLRSTTKLLKQSIFTGLSRIHFSLVNNYNDTVTNRWINNIKLTLFLTHSLFFLSFNRQTNLSLFQRNSSGHMEA